jgi:hypothetical protein
MIADEVNMNQVTICAKMVPRNLIKQQPDVRDVKILGGIIMFIWCFIRYPTLLLASCYFDVTRQCFCAGTITKELPPKRRSPLLTTARRITLTRRVKNTANKTANKICHTNDSHK